MAIGALFISTPATGSANFSENPCFHPFQSPFNKMSSSDELNQTFERPTSGASLTFPMQCSALRKNGFVVLNGRPCKIVDMSTSKTGKHGHAKVNLVGIDIFNGRKYEDMCPSTHNMDVPHVKRDEYLLTYVDEGFLNLMLPNGDAKDDVKLPEGELGDEISAAFASGKVLFVAILSSMGEEAAIAFKEAPKD
jgi:translation initiation factor 5A